MPPPDYFDTATANNNYTTAELIRDEMSDAGVDLRLDDDDKGYVTSTETSGLVTAGDELRLRRIISWSTGIVNTYLTKRYDASELQLSWVVCYWATIAACWRLCKRRMNPNPFQAEWEEIQEKMMDVQTGRMDISEIGERFASIPCVDNFRIDARYHTKMVRLQKSISDKTPSQHVSNTDFVDRVVPDLP